MELIQWNCFLCPPYPKWKLNWGNLPLNETVAKLPWCNFYLHSKQLQGSHKQETPPQAFLSVKSIPWIKLLVPSTVPGQGSKEFICSVYSSLPAHLELPHNPLSAASINKPSRLYESATSKSYQSLTPVPSQSQRYLVGVAGTITNTDTTIRFKGSITEKWCSVSIEQQLPP